MAIKIVLFIVEGPSDEETLSAYITKLMFKNRKKLSVQITYGDKTSENIPNSKTLFTVTADNINQYIENIIIEYLNRKDVKDLGIKAKNIEYVFYVTDTDNCFFEETLPRLNKKECLSKMFNFKEIEVYQNQVQRRQEKQKNISERKIPRVPFETIFFAKDLEAVTIGNSEKLTDELKEKLSNDFAQNSLLIDGFFEKVFRDSSLMQWETFEKSYIGIKTYKDRASNMNNFLDKVDSWKKKD